MNKEIVRVTICGAAETVTGSKYLIEVGKSKLLVDCGIFQGLKELRLRNWKKPPFDPSSVSAVVLTHAHIDHIGSLNKLKIRYKVPAWLHASDMELYHPQDLLLS